MAITNQERVEDVLISWRRQADGSLATFASRVNIVEEVDDSTTPPTYTAMRHTLAQAIDGAEVTAIVGDQLPGLIAERDAAQAQATQAAADLTAMTSDRDAKAAALADMTTARDTLQAQLDAIQNPPIPHVISQRFKIALDDLYPGLLDTVEAFVASQPRTTQLRWQFPEFYRDDAMLNQMAASLIAQVPALAGTTADALLDAVFGQAKTIT